MARRESRSNCIFSVGQTPARELPRALSGWVLVLAPFFATGAFWATTSAPAHAFLADPVSLSEASATSPVPVWGPSLIPQESSLGLDTVGYLHSSSDGAQGYQNSLSPEVMGRLSTRSQGAVFEGSAQADLLLMFEGLPHAPGSPSVYAEAPELYAGTSLKLAPVQVTVGRKLEDWNHLDQEWSLGIWQPRFRWDYLHPETVALTGISVRVEQPLFKFVAWGSPIFVPERGVPISNDGGELSSDSRWFIPPPSMANLLGRDTRVQYTLAMPGMSSLLLHPGASVMARVGRAQGVWGSVGAAYKPMNQLLLAESATLRPTNPPYGDATIYPRVLYHELASVEGGYQSEPLSAWVSVLGEHPLSDQTPANWTDQEVVPSLAASSTVDFRIAGEPKRATRMDLSYLHQWGGNAGDQGQDAHGGSTSMFDARYPFQSAVAMGLRSDAIARVSASTRLVYDMDHEGAIWSTELRYRPRERWMLGVGADLLTSAQSDDSDGTNMFARFNADDRVHAGVSYVF